MKRNDDDTITLTQEELNDIREFIDNSLDHEWDRYTNNFICGDSWEDGKRSMNPTMYDMAQQMLLI